MAVRSRDIGRRVPRSRTVLPRSQPTAPPQPGATTPPDVNGGLGGIPRWRVYVLWFVSIAVTVWIGARLFEVQVARRDYWAGFANSEIHREIPLQPARGTITDRFGNMLAMDIDRQSLWAAPPLMNEERKPAIAITLASIIGRDPAVVQQQLLDPDTEYVRLARWLEPDVAAQVAALDEPGLDLVYEPIRFYPQGQLAAQVVGAVNREGQGISGVESYYNDTLQGVTGTINGAFDPAYNPITIAPQRTRPARNGANLQLTIDPVIQHIAETELHKAVEQNSASGGSVVVLEVATGAVRGMASWPPFDPNSYDQYPEGVYARNPAVSDLYEPGSTFKMLTVAAGLESGAFTADTRVNDTGVIWRYGEDLKNWNSAGNGAITPDEVLYYSSNVGALLLNELTGPPAFYDTLRRFSIGKPTGIDLGGEEAGILHPHDAPTYNDLIFLTNAYGQGVSVTPLQMTVAAAALANNGVVMRPYIVEQICTDGECVATEPRAVEQAVGSDVAWTVRRMLARSANHYGGVVWGERTGNWGDQYLVPGYEIAAKTGTSSIPLPGGGYDQTATIGSVLGFAPTEEARYAVLVKVDRPADFWGVLTAIPLYQTIVSQLLEYDRVPPQPGLYSPGQ